ncbi:serine/threonine protein phosphatase 1 [Pseudomonas sp. BIGb0278]|uniref:metallophosphoesterase n=1 Tax=Pseudomonas sp. BIGb0278 TaxID=2940607 RepID=UPI002169AED9|nr:metallophosphoesterase [Pseudomonas sp. BIGb0278]MCS4283045.1 serine/threonine protein phosphatase 1 [Pseudomonas sp. BIGb0278]
MQRFQQIAANELGRDLAVGDIHGHFPRLQQCLDEVAFDPQVDRLFSVGDLVDRGPHSEEALEWLGQPWFHAVQGNHEALAVSYLCGDPLDLDMYRAAGGGWFLDLPSAVQQRYASVFVTLPLALQVATVDGPIGLVHADSPFNEWSQLRTSLLGEDDPRVREICQWSRRRLREGDTHTVEGLRALLVGHTSVLQVKQLGNVWHLDTGGWNKGHFSLLDMQRLVLLSPATSE